VSSANAAVDHLGCPALLTDLLTLAVDGLGEDVADACRVLAEDVRVDAQGHHGIGVAEAGSDDVDGDARQEQCGRVQVAQVMQPGVGQRLGRASDRLVVAVDSLVMRAVSATA
jgi:hypothetical protein